MYLPFTENANFAYWLAVKLAKSDFHDHVSTESLLLSLMKPFDRKVYEEFFGQNFDQAVRLYKHSDIEPPINDSRNLPDLSPSIAGTVLSALGLDFEQTYQLARSLNLQEPVGNYGTTNFEHLNERSRELAEQSGNLVSTAHLLLAILQDCGSIAYKLLENQKIDIEVLRSRTLQLYSKAGEVTKHTDV